MKVVVISGPTASGKTGISIELAQKFGGEIVNFDSLLLYKEINIGTAKPSLEEQKSIPHHLIDVRSISEPMNAADYSVAAKLVINEILKRNKTVYLVGGSGFYLQAVLKGMYDSPTTPKSILDKSEVLYEQEGIDPFIEVLKIKDRSSFERYHVNDHYRIRRAVEHWWAHETPFSEVRANKTPSLNDWDVFHLHLDLPKEEHSKIIEKRTDQILKGGLEKEVRDLLAQGFIGTEKPLQSIGYKEMLNFVFGVIKTSEECRERIIISTRQLAKSQRTWFKKDLSKKTFHPLEQRDEISAQVDNFLKN